MEAANNGKAPSHCEYTEYAWSDRIEGSKAQLQALGLGIGLAYPGEPGCPAAVLKVWDPRGHCAVIWPCEQYRDHDQYARFTACIVFVPEPEEKPISWSPNVSTTRGLKKRECLMFDEYLGRAEDLAAAGLLNLDQLPGKPGMRKVVVTIFADGVLSTKENEGARRGTCDLPGTRQIQRISASIYRLKVMVPKDEARRRLAAIESGHVRESRPMVRPARLQPMAREKWASFEAACASAARDVRFQGAIARLLGTAGPAAA